MTFDAFGSTRPRRRRTCGSIPPGGARLCRDGRGERGVGLHRRTPATPAARLLSGPGRPTGAAACRELLSALQEGKVEANFLEGMGCVGGCVGGPKAILNREEGSKRQGDTRISPLI
jgi:hypothetical protein